MLKNSSGVAIKWPPLMFAALALYVYIEASAKQGIRF
jgi:hypothetical protein